MQILLTGASSFTGTWYAKSLAERGHHVVATFTRPGPEAYRGIRAERVRQVLESCEAAFDCRFGDDRFLELIERTSPNVLCHHAADVTDYKSADFDYLRALGNNTHQLPSVIAALQRVECNRMVVTGSVFEEGEGAGTEPLGNFSPYGLSKSLTWITFRYFAAEHGFSLGKFVIPNPFGPFEDPRFTAYLTRMWGDGRVAEVRHPEYVRDNIHVSLLGRAYAEFVSALPAVSGVHRTNPSGYVESQLAFAQRFAGELRQRLNWPCELTWGEQQEFTEPRVRINTTSLDTKALGWDEAAAWDRIAEYYAPKVGAKA